MNAVVKIGDSEFEPARLDRAQILAAAESGLLERLGRVEVIEGVIVKLSPSWMPHAKALFQLCGYFQRTLSGKFGMSVDQIVLFGPDGMHAPDIAFFDKTITDKALDAGQLLLALEVADTSLDYDLGVKAKTYAAFGVPELWVVDLENKRLVIHRDPAADGYGSVQSLQWTQAASPLIASDLDVVLADILPG